MDWGLRNRISKIIVPDTGRSVMLAVDHGYFLGPTSKLEVPGKTIMPLAPYADAIMLTRRYATPWSSEFREARA
jgi:putative autoinducer-2 (AI-2) aldolase